jgi:hypothetical protein
LHVPSLSSATIEVLAIRKLCFGAQVILRENLGIGLEVRRRYRVTRDAIKH